MTNRIAAWKRPRIRPQTTARQPACLLAILLSIICATTADAQYQPRRGGSTDQKFQDGDAVRESARDILARPEFRHFRRLKGEKGFQIPVNMPFHGQDDNPPDWGPADRPDDQNQRNQDWNRDQWNQDRNRDQQNQDLARQPPDNPQDDPLADRNDNAFDRDDADANNADAFWGDGENDGELAEAGAGAGASTAGGAIGGLYTGFSVVLLVVIVGLIGYAIAKSWAGGATSIADTTTEKSSMPQIMGDIEPDTAPGELPADVYIAEAEKMAEQGLFREAIAQLLLGAMSNVERSGLIRYRRGLTHRDYLRAVRSDESLHASMRSMVRLYEPLGFGRRDATRKHFDMSLNGYETGFHGTSPVVNL